MKPLRSPVLEYGIIGAFGVLAGLGIAAIATRTHSIGVVAAAWSLSGVLVGSVMYLLAYRRYTKEAVQVAGPVPSNARCETTRTTVVRVLLRALALVPVLAFALALSNPASIGGVSSGNGAVLLVISRWIARWQRRNHVVVLREPRYRWKNDSARKRLGRGVMDSRDFYILPREDYATARDLGTPRGDAIMASRIGSPK